MDAATATATPEARRRAATASRQTSHQPPGHGDGVTAHASHQPPSRAAAGPADHRAEASRAPRQYAATAASAHSPLSRRPHRLLACPECGGRLLKDKHPVMAETGTALRKRLCSRCGCAVHSRQPAEEITIVEHPE